MEFEFTPQQKQLRREVQAFIAENMTDILRAFRPGANSWA